MIRTNLLTFIVCAPLAGCSLTTSTSSDSQSSAQATTSDTVDTASLSPSLSAQDYGDGSGVHVYAAFLDPKGRWVEVTNGDSLTATNGTDNIVLTREENDENGEFHYTGIFPSNVSAQTVMISLVRPPAKISATSSATVVGAPFTITSAVPSTMKIGATTSIAISPAPILDTKSSGDSWELTASGDCIDDYIIGSTSAGAMDAKGAFVFDSSKLTFKKDSSGNQGQGAGCGLTIFVKHIHFGKIDPSFGGSVLDGDAVIADVPNSTYAVEGLQARVATTTISP